MPFLIAFVGTFVAVRLLGKALRGLLYAVGWCWGYLDARLPGTGLVKHALMVVGLLTALSLVAHW
jgi:hypothetical protein